MDIIVLLNEYLTKVKGSEKRKKSKTVISMRRLKIQQGFENEPNF